MKIFNKDTIYKKSTDTGTPQTSANLNDLSGPAQIESILKLFEKSNELTATSLELSFIKYFEERYRPAASKENLGVRLKTKYVLTEDDVRNEIVKAALEKSNKDDRIEEAKKERIRKSQLKEAEKERKKKFAQEKRYKKEKVEKAAKKKQKSKTKNREESSEDENDYDEDDDDVVVNKNESGLIKTKCYLCSMEWTKCVEKKKWRSCEECNYWCCSGCIEEDIDEADEFLCKKCGY